ncbi:MAG: chromosome segregation protein SMC [Acidimicrobiales bacterium]
MFLKGLTLKGFKSFADTTTLDFEPGVTVVVGPNGSGKSNVVDAIGWVLGAQAPSAVRSQKMDDVIFAGTTKRPALGRAEVSLTLDNSSGLLPIDFSEVTVTRTLWRSGDSEYAINGVPCRLLDVHELFSDTGVGRQQHVIVGQGQIDAVLNARPEDRRLVIEEAAGVLKHRKRKERSERRLAATEGNLLRLQDLQREVRRQLRPLERQAEAARQHGTLVAELRELQVYIAGRELSTLRRRLADASAARAEAAAEERANRMGLAELDASVLAAEAELAAVGGDDLGDALGRVEALREKARGLLAVLSERQRGLEREREAFVDQEVIATLEVESARLESDLSEVEQDTALLTPELETLAREEKALADARQRFETEWADGVPTSSGKAAEARGELAAMRKASQGVSAELERARQRLARLGERVERLGDEVARLDDEITTAEKAEGELVAAVDTAERARTDADQRATAAEDRHREAQAEHLQWKARSEALTVALDDHRTRAGVERLADVDGVFGTLLDLVEIDPGWEPAVEAACGEALAAVVVSSVDAGRAAVEVLAEGDLSGAVLAIEAARPVGTAPPVGDPVRAHVHPRRPDVAALLDALVGPAVVVHGGWADAIDTALSYPEAIVVTQKGGRLAAAGWRAMTATTGATAAALDEARERGTAATSAAEAAEAERSAAVAERKVAQGREEAARRELGEHRRRLSVATERRTRAVTDRDEAQAEVATMAPQLEEQATKIRRDQERVAELEALLPTLEAEDAEIDQRKRAMADARHALDERAASTAGRRRDADMRSAALADRRDFLTQRLQEVRARLARSTEAWQAAHERRDQIDQTDEALLRLRVYVSERAETLQAQLSDLQDRRRAQSEAQRSLTGRLDGLRRQRLEGEKTLEAQRERGKRAEMEETEVRLRLEQATETCRTQLDIEPHVAINAPTPTLSEGVPAAARVRELERELRLLGPINPLALEEFEALEERHRFLQEQLDDVKGTRRELAKVIRAVDDEIVRIFAAAYADVRENFEQLFSTLFPGGQGGLRLTNPDDLLNCGIEIEAKPSGKNVKKLSLLSGGERSLTALAFLFAVFRSRPSPFYVMDEVEAALDDVNLHRFLDLVAEFRREAQLVIVSHQKRTMEAADSLYGVTMQPGGSSKVVSERVAA